MGVIRPYACSGDRVGDADRRPPVPHRDAVGAWERPEVVIERTVLLDDEDQVLEVLLGLLELGQVGNGRRRPRRRRARLSRPARGRRAGGCERRGQDERDHEERRGGGGGGGGEAAVQAAASVAARTSAITRRGGRAGFERMDRPRVPTVARSGWTWTRQPAAVAARARR